MLLVHLLLLLEEPFHFTNIKGSFHNQFLFLHFFSSFLLPAKPCFHICRVCFENTCSLLGRLLNIKEDGREKQYCLKHGKLQKEKLHRALLQLAEKNHSFY